MAQAQIIAKVRSALKGGGVTKLLHHFVLCTILVSAMSWAQTNPLPFVSQSLSPESIVPGGAGLTLTVNGANFVSASVVNWNGAPLNTTFVSAGRLTAAVPATNIAAQGMAWITVSSPAPGGGISNVEFLPIAAAIASTSVSLNKVDYALAAPPITPIVGDFNGDGKLDLAVTSPSKVSVLLGNGDGTFAPPITSAGPAIPSVYAKSGDFNGDGKLDFVGNDQANGYLYVQLGNGDGTFKPYVETPASSLHVLAVGDFNGDGQLDVASGNYSQNGAVSVYFGSGDGTFYAGGSFTPTDEQPLELVPGDFNGDGILDLAVACTAGSSIDLLIGNGDGTFVKKQVWQNNTPSRIVAGDLNNDGVLDLAFSGNFPYVEIIFGNGDGTFSQSSFTRTASLALAIGDLNSDGNLDLAAGDGGGFSGVVELFIASGPGIFGFDPIDVATEYPTTFAVLGDFNGDGRLDEVSPGNLSDVSIFYESDLDLSPASLAFPTVLLGRTSAPQIATLANVGVVPITITSISSSAAFPQTNTCGSSLPAGASCTISVSFAPTAEGPQSGTVVVDNSNVGPLTVSLTGTGLLTWVDLQPSSLNFGAVAVGTSSQPQVVTLTNTNTERPLLVTGISIVGADAGDFTQTNNCRVVLRGASCTIDVTFTPTATGARNAYLRLVDNGGDSPQRVPLKGTGT